MTGALAGIRVLDLTQLVAGPVATMMLGDFGADVIKVEPPGGDIMRKTGETFLGQSGDSDIYFSVNRNKRSVVADLKNETDRASILQLAAGADVLVENFRPGTTEKLGLGYEALATINPRLVYCSVTGFGPSGKNRDRPAVDQVIQALSGIMQLTGTRDSGPLRTGFPYSDFIASVLAVVGILAALQARERTGKGQRVDLSMLNATIFGMLPRESYYMATGDMPPRFGNGHFLLAPCNTYTTSDHRQVLVYAHQPKFWEALLGVLDDAALRADERFQTNDARLKNRAELDRRIGDIIARAPLAEWNEKLGKAGVLYAPVRTFDEVFADSEVQRDMLVELEHATAGKLRLLANPLQLSDTPATVRRAPPILGEHTREILGKAGWEE